MRKQNGKRRIRGRKEVDGDGVAVGMKEEERSMGELVLGQVEIVVKEDNVDCIWTLPVAVSEGEREGYV